MLDKDFDFEKEIQETKTKIEYYENKLKDLIFLRKKANKIELQCFATLQKTSNGHYLFKGKKDFYICLGKYDFDYLLKFIKDNIELGRGLEEDSVCVKNRHLKTVYMCDEYCFFTICETMYVCNKKDFMECFLKRGVSDKCIGFFYSNLVDDFEKLKNE